MVRQNYIYQDQDFMIQIILIFTMFVLCVASLIRYLRRNDGPFPILFISGCIFYWLVPLGAIILSDSEYVYFIFKQLPDLANELKMSFALLLVAAFIFATIVGYHVGMKLYLKLPKMSNFSLNLLPDDSPFKIFCFVCIITLWMLFIGSAYGIKEYLFKGYDSHDPMLEAQKGSMSAYAIAMVVLSFIGFNKPSSGFFRWVFISPIGWLVLSTWIILLGLGGRMYVLTCIIIGVLVQTDAGYRLPTWMVQRYKEIILVILGIGLLGIYRIGLNFSFGNVMQNIFGESFWTAYSLLTCVDIFSTWKPFEWPQNFITSGVGILPSFIVGNKSDIIVTLNQMGYAVESPLGACNLFASVVCNFGYVGGTIFFLIFGGFYGFMWRNCRIVLTGIGLPDRFGIVIYSILLSVVPFMLFRDPFAVSLFQMILKTGLIIPLLLVIVYGLMTIRRSRYGALPGLQ